MNTHAGASAPTTRAPAGWVQRRRLGAATVALILAPITINTVFSASATATPAAPAKAAPVGLSVTISDGVKQVHPNLDVTYTAKLSNSGTKPVTANLVLTVPGYLTYRDTAGAKVSKQDAEWPVTVAAGQSVTKKVTARIGSIPKAERRVTSLATVYTGKTTGVPLIRSADASSIAGVADLPNTAKATPADGKTSASHSDGSHRPWLLGSSIGVVLLAVLAASAVYLRRRGTPGRRRRQNAHSPS